MTRMDISTDSRGLIRLRGYVLLVACFCVTHTLRLVHAADCEKDYNCKLPDCNCAPDVTPHGIDNKHIPPMVLFAYTGAINYDSWDHLEHTFPTTYKNPNDCPIAITVFVRGNFDECTVSALYKRGHEIATQGNKTGDWNGTVSHRSLIEDKARIPEGHIVGFRAPDSKPGGDEQFETLSDNGFVYDASLILDFYQSTPSSRPYWPFTFSKRFGQDNFPKCGPNENCPQSEYKSFWEFPLGGLFLPIEYQIYGHSKCRYVSECAAYAQNNSILDTLKFSYNRHFNERGNFAPLVLNFRQNVYVQEEVTADLEAFVAYLNKETDAYIVTFQDALEWIKNAKKTNTSEKKPKDETEIDKGTDVWKCPTRKLSGTCRRSRFLPAGYFDNSNTIFWPLVFLLVLFLLGVWRYEKMQS